MGGRRGYGPTHSQSLEKLLVGVPGIVVVATSECHDLGALLAAAIDDDRPVFFVENKLMYGRANRRPDGGYVDAFRCTESAGRYAALTFSGNDFGGGSATIVTYGGMLPIALDAAAELILEHELFCEVVALSQLLPLDVVPVLESVARTGAVVTAEEGTRTGGIGAEIAAQVQELAWRDLRGRAEGRGRRRADPGGSRPRGGGPAAGARRRGRRSRARIDAGAARLMLEVILTREDANTEFALVASWLVPDGSESNGRCSSFRSLLSEPSGTSQEATSANSRLTSRIEDDLKHQAGHAGIDAS